MEAVSVLRPWSSVAGDLERLFTDERVKLAMSFHQIPRDESVPCLPFHDLAFLEYNMIFHAKGGLGNITNRMAEIANTSGWTSTGNLG